MKRKVNPFLLGLFTLLGLGFGLAGLLWVGVAGVMQKSRTYASFFNFPIEGLVKGSPVSYLGVYVGQITEIGIAPDPRLVRVLLEIRSDLKPDAAMYLQPSSQGLAGQAFLALRRAEGAPPRLPDLSFPVSYPVLPNAPGEMDQVMDQAREIVNELAALDLRGLVAEWRAAGGGVRALAASPGLQRSLGHVEGAAADLQRILGGLAGSRPGAWRDIQQDIAGTAEALRAGSRRLAEQLTAVERGQLARTADRVESLAEAGEKAVNTWDRQADASFAQLQRTLSDLNRLVADLDHLVRALRREPGQILKRQEGADPFGGR